MEYALNIRTDIVTNIIICNVANGQILGVYVGYN